MGKSESFDLDLDFLLPLLLAFFAEASPFATFFPSLFDDRFLLAFLGATSSALPEGAEGTGGGGTGAEPALDCCFLTGGGGGGAAGAAD